MAPFHCFVRDTGFSKLYFAEVNYFPSITFAEDAVHPLHFRNESHDTTEFSTVEVITPCVSIYMEKFEQKRRLGKTRRTPHGRDNGTWSIYQPSQTDRQTDRQVGGQAGRQAGRQADRQAGWVGR